MNMQRYSKLSSLYQNNNTLQDIENTHHSFIEEETTILWIYIFFHYFWLIKFDDKKGFLNPQSFP